MKDERVRPQQMRKTKSGWKKSYSRNGANHMKMEGVTVKAGELFDLGDGVKAKAPSQSGVAAHDCNCRCFIEYNLMTPDEFAKATGQTEEQVLKRYGLSNVTTPHKKAYTKVKVEDIPPMDKDRFEKIKQSLEKKGVSVIQDREGDAFLSHMGAEALTLSDGSAVIFQSGRVPSASAVFEEVIHVGQIRKKGVVDEYGNKQGTLEYLSREIEAGEKLIKNKRAYRLTEKDVESVRENLESYYKEFDKVKKDV